MPKAMPKHALQRKGKAWIPLPTGHVSAHHNTCYIIILIIFSESAYFRFKLNKWEKISLLTKAHIFVLNWINEIKLDWFDQRASNIASACFSFFLHNLIKISLPTKAHIFVLNWINEKNWLLVECREANPPCEWSD